eukprot:4241254-Pyramimonas_sp.AAC.1
MSARWEWVEELMVDQQAARRRLDAAGHGMKLQGGRPSWRRWRMRSRGAETSRTATGRAAGGADQKMTD